MVVEYHGTLNGGGKGRNTLSLQEIQRLCVYPEMPAILKIFQQCNNDLSALLAETETGNLESELLLDTVFIKQSLLCIDGLAKNHIGVLSNPEAFIHLDPASPLDKSNLIKKPELEPFNYLKHMNRKERADDIVQLPLFYDKTSYEKLPEMIQPLNLHLHAISGPDAFDKTQLADALNNIVRITKLEEVQRNPKLKPITDLLYAASLVLQKEEKNIFKDPSDGPALN